ncbi:MAG: HSP20 family protein [Pirellulaceae bacterium]|jgi:HSP20 family protein
MSATNCNTNQCEAPKTSALAFTPRIDVIENEDSFWLYADVPGVEPADLEVKFEDGELTIHGKLDSKCGDVDYLAREYRVGDFVRKVTLGELVDVDKIDAHLENGVLRVELPKSEAKKPRRIHVNS